jgi:release factor glutamine methyltransferase
VRDRFRAGDIDTPERDARLLAEAAFGLGPLALVSHERDAAPAEGLLRLDRFAERRLAGEPVARIVGRKDFWGLGFALNEASLVPRPETEMLVRRGLEEVANVASPAILDLGTGTGCIPIALLTERADALATAVDLSGEALAMAARNAAAHGVGERLTLLEGSWFAPMPADVRFHLITANPPYIETAAIGSLSREVRDHDPGLALDGGADGLDAYRAIVRAAGRHLMPGGALLFEIGATQAGAVTGLCRNAGFGAPEIERDLSGFERMVVARLW